MTFLIGGANTLDDASYEISNSCRFNGSSTEMEDTLGTPTNIKKFTISLWFKRSALYADISTGQSLISCYRGAKSNPFGALNFGGNDEIEFFGFDDENTTVMNLQTNAGRFRDPSAWYHVVYAVDTTQSTDTNRVKIYVNGVQETSFSVSTYPAENKELAWNQSSTVHYIGHYQYTNATWMNGYEAEFAFIDGSQLAPSSFGETNDNGVWIPKEFKDDVTFGDNGYYLEFKQTGTSQNSSGIGADTSGNDRHFAVSNLAATNITADTPTNNFCTLNNIKPDTTGAQNHTFSEGNTLVRSSSASWFNAFGTIGIPTSGKWYYEYKTTGSGTIDQNIGFVKGNFHRGGNGGTDQADCYSLYAGSDGNGYLHTDSSSGVNKGSGYCWTHDDIMMVAIDTSSRKIWYGKNGTWLGSGDPAGGSNEKQTVSVEDLAYGLLPAFSGYHTASYHYVNFGNPAYANSSSQADDAGYGDFEYDVPTGFYSLCTKNLGEYG